MRVRRQQTRSAATHGLQLATKLSGRAAITEPRPAVWQPHRLYIAGEYDESGAALTICGCGDCPVARDKCWCCGEE